MARWWNAAAAVTTAVFLSIAPTTTDAFSRFGHSARIFDDSWGLHGFGGGSGWYEEPAPCPHYEPMRLSSWTEHSDGRDEFALHAVLPGVQRGHRRAWLSKDGSMVHVSAARALPVGGRSCLPRDARVSADGRYELFEETAAVPLNGNAAGATLRETRNGLEILLPHRPASPMTTRTRDKARSAASINAALGESAMRPPTPTPVAAKSAASFVPRLRASQPLPFPSDGVEVLDDGFMPWPEKNPDASEGWWDNRGDFHEY